MTNLGLDKFLFLLFNLPSSILGRMEGRHFINFQFFHSRLWIKRRSAFSQLPAHSSFFTAHNSQQLFFTADSWTKNILSDNPSLSGLPVAHVTTNKYLSVLKGKQTTHEPWVPVSWMLSLQTTQFSAHQKAPLFLKKIRFRIKLYYIHRKKKRRYMAELTKPKYSCKYYKP
jgi:hypothetical protein